MWSEYNLMTVLYINVCLTYSTRQILLFFLYYWLIKRLKRLSCVLSALKLQKQRESLGLEIWYKSRISFTFGLWFLISGYYGSQFKEPFRDQRLAREKKMTKLVNDKAVVIHYSKTFTNWMSHRLCQIKMPKLSQYPKMLSSELNCFSLW